jgi:hypothetical protein
MTGAVFTFGYGGSLPAHLLRTVRKLGITHVLDCRRRPRSRIPAWNAGSIIKLLVTQAPEVQYVLRGEDLGGYPPGTEVPENPPPVSDAAMETLREAACLRGERLLLICAEKAPGECHRHMTIAFPLAKRAAISPDWWSPDVPIRHVFEETLIEPMELQRAIDDPDPEAEYECEELEDETGASAAPASSRQRYRYDLQGADEAGERRHPQIAILEHFPDADHFEPMLVGSCWLFEASPREGAPAFFVKLPAEGAEATTS